MYNTLRHDAHCTRSLCMHSPMRNSNLGKTIHIYVAEVPKMMHQVQIAQAIGNIRRKAIVYTDSRVRSVSEVLTGIRVVKCNGWTAAFLKRISDLRAIEMRWIRKASFLRASTATLRVK